MRVDMSEMYGKNSSTDFTDALVRLVANQPLSVLLFDELEKANIGALDILLQVLSDGRVTDSSGRTVSLRQSLIIMTSNVGFGVGAIASRGQRSMGFVAASPGGGARTPTREDIDRALTAQFRPELLGRIDRVVVFDPLSADAVNRIVRREIGQALNREGLRRRGLQVRCAPELEQMIAETGTDPRYGARPIVRRVQELVVMPIARWLTERGGGVSGSWVVSVGGDGVPRPCPDEVGRPGGLRRTTSGPPIAGARRR